MDARHGTRLWHGELIVAKQRHGATGKVRMRFDSRVTKFSDPIDEDSMPELRG